MTPAGQRPADVWALRGRAAGRLRSHGFELYMSIYLIKTGDSLARSRGRCWGPARHDRHAQPRRLLSGCGLRTDCPPPLTTGLVSAKALAPASEPPWRHGEGPSRPSCGSPGLGTPQAGGPRRREPAGGLRPSRCSPSSMSSGRPAVRPPRPSKTRATTFSTSSCPSSIGRCTPRPSRPRRSS